MHKKAYLRKHHQAALPPPTTFDLCVGNRENGEPGATTFDTIHWNAVNGNPADPYHGAYSFLHSTWTSMGGGRYAYNANEATPSQQSAIFNYGARTDPSAWPTIPPCE